jgi:hypothetical protein
MYMKLLDLTHSAEFFFNFKLSSSLSNTSTGAVLFLIPTMKPTSSLTVILGLINLVSAEMRVSPLVSAQQPLAKTSIL